MLELIHDPLCLRSVDPVDGDAPAPLREATAAHARPRPGSRARGSGPATAGCPRPGSGRSHRCLPSCGRCERSRRGSRPRWSGRCHRPPLRSTRPAWRSPPMMAISRWRGDASWRPAASNARRGSATQAKPCSVRATTPGIAQWPAPSLKPASKQALLTAAAAHGMKPCLYHRVMALQLLPGAAPHRCRGRPPWRRLGRRTWPGPGPDSTGRRFGGSGHRGVKLPGGAGRRRCRQPRVGALHIR